MQKNDQLLRELLAPIYIEVYPLMKRRLLVVVMKDVYHVSGYNFFLIRVRP